MTRRFPELPEDVPQVEGLMSEDVPRFAESPRTNYHREYMRRYRAKFRYTLNDQRRARRRERLAGPRPGGGCVKCELFLGCGGLFCAAGTRGQANNDQA